MRLFILLCLLIAVVLALDLKRLRRSPSRKTISIALYEENPTWLRRAADAMGRRAKAVWNGARGVVGKLKRPKSSGAKRTAVKQWAGKKISGAKGLFGKLRTKLRRPKRTQIAAHQFLNIESSGSAAEEGSGVADLEEELNAEASGNVTDEITAKFHKEKLGSSVTHGYLRSMMRIRIDGHSYEMLLDTGSSLTWIPQQNCVFNPPVQIVGNTFVPTSVDGDDDFESGNFLELDSKVESDPENGTLVVNRALRVHRQGHRFNIEYLGVPNAPEMLKPRAAGFLRDGTVQLGRNAYSAKFGTADIADNYHFPILGASPPKSGHPNLLETILRRAGMSDDWNIFSVVLTEVPPNLDPNRAAINGHLTLGDLDTEHCGEIAYWTPMNSSPSKWTVFYEEWKINGVPVIFPLGAPNQITLDTGAPGLRLNERVYHSVVEAIRRTPGVRMSPQPFAAQKYAINCDAVFEVALLIRHDPAAFHEYTVKIRSYNLIVPRGNVCLLAIVNGGAHERLLIGVPFYRSVCVIHDFRYLRVGLAPRIR